MSKLQQIKNTETPYNTTNVKEIYSNSIEKSYYGKDISDY
jgi:hypothetical protein